MNENRDDPAVIAAMANMGVAQLRTRIVAGQWPPHLIGTADRWLKQQDQESERVALASQSEQIEISRLTKDAAIRASSAAERQAIAAEKANQRATIALALAAISIMMTIVSMFVGK